ncbi:hypothetical protein [Sandaracinus amylolyticus]|uniref:hypothetical protein n=1 Tax=Sandaracinus amylolyticus TaxID=927083 RepID=UPI00069CD473|nr:hypothetical protein [Sandaracinus amylolyticus]
MLAIACVGLAPTIARAQDGPPEEHEEAGRSRGGRAWGEEGGEGGEGAQRPAYHHYGQAFASLGVGGTVRILAHAAVCDPGVPGREGCRFSPPYLQLRGGWFFEGDGDLQHGAGLGIGTNLTPDGTAGLGIDAFGQWVLTPSYFLRYWFDQWFQLMGHFGVPLALSAVTGTSRQASTDFNWGLELQVGLVFKFLTGLGAYAAVNGAMFFAGDSMVWPTVSGEIGLMFEYEVLP